MPTLLTHVAMIVLFATSSIAGQSAFWQSSEPDRAARRGMEPGFANLDKQVPTLSPREADSLKKEYDEQIAGNDGKFTARALAATDSREYRISLARRHLDLLMPHLRSLAAPGPPPNEVGLWARVAELMIEPQFWQAIEKLQDQKLIKPPVNGVSQFYLENHVAWGQAVLRKIVIPAVERKQ